MPQALAALLVSIGVSALLATVIATAVFVIGGTLLSGLLTGKGGAKSERTERAIKNPTPARNHAYGARRLFGAYQLFDTAASGSTVDVWAFHDGRANDILQAYINDEPADVSGGYILDMGDGAYADSSVQVGWNLGLDTETAFAPVVALMGGIWGTDHRGDGVVSAYLIKAPVKDKVFLERYPQGDNVMLSLAGEWQLCFDPREVTHDPDDQDTWEWTENAVLQLLHYFMVRRSYDYATRLEPVIDYWIAAADHADEAVSLDAGGTEPRYRGCVAYDATSLPGDITSELLACFDGWTAQDENGCHLVYSGEVYTPTVTIGPDEIVAYSHQAFVEDENFVNELIVQYISADHKYATVECQAWRDETDIASRGRINSDGFAPQVPSHTQARRLAKRAMARRNVPDRGSVTTNFSGRSVIGQRYVDLLIEEAGTTLFEGVAEIVGLERNYDTGGVTFEWVSVDANVDNWNPATEDGEPAPIGSRVPLDTLDAPTIDTVTVIDGPMLEIEATGPDREDLTWFVHWREDGATLWGPDETHPDTTGASITLTTGTIPLGVTLEVEVAYMVGDGRVSPWSTLEEVIVDVEIIYDGGSA